MSAEDDLSTMGTGDLAAARYIAHQALELATDDLVEAEKKHRAAAYRLAAVDDALDVTIACPHCDKPVGEPCWLWANSHNQGQRVHSSRRSAARAQAADDLGKIP